jgi:hypothetical protein
MESVTRDIDEGNPVDVIYLDFAKAFDKIPHNRLFKKLEAHGICGLILNWIKCWLTLRRQKVNINQEDSEWRFVISGVPQGSVLGPVLFLIYINDLDRTLISRIFKFADDTKLCKTVQGLEQVEALQRDLDSLHEWSLTWQMSFNVNKCAVMHIGHNNGHHSYTLGDQELNSTVSERDLGVTMDKNLKFSEQCSKVVKSANSMLGLIRRTIKSRRKDVIVRLYKALVRPKLEYCVQAWRPFLRKDIDGLERVQRRATRLITDCRGKNYESRLKIAGLISLENRQTRGDLIQVFKLVKSIENVDYHQFFRLADNIVTRGHKYKIIKDRSRLEIRRNFFSQRIVNVWNSLPSYIVEADSVNSFKNKFDKYSKILF